MRTDAVVRAEHLTRRYGSLTAVRNIHFSIRPGECYGFLGPNGAGKTSTIRMITCRIPLTEGSLHVFDLDVRDHPTEIKQRMGVVGQEDNLDEALTVRENLLIYAQYFGQSAAEAAATSEQLMRFMDLEEKRDVPPRHLSGGLKRRLAIARALVNDPELLILDEPTTGLDPEARRLVWQRLAELKRRGVTLVLTTHYMEEASRLCDRVAIMHAGEIRAEGPPDALIRRHTGKEVVEVDEWTGNLPAWLEHVREHGVGMERPAQPLLGFRRIGRSFHLYSERSEFLIQALQQQGVVLESYQIRPATLEDVFLELTGAAMGAEEL